MSGTFIHSGSMCRPFPKVGAEQSVGLIATILCSRHQVVGRVVFAVRTGDFRAAAHRTSETLCLHRDWSIFAYVTFGQHYCSIGGLATIVPHVPHSIYAMDFYLQPDPEHAMLALRQMGGSPRRTGESTSTVTREAENTPCETAFLSLLANRG